jgi:hypothetical protein
LRFRTDAALLAGERHQPFGVALPAHHAQEAVFEHTTTQVSLELLAHACRHAAVFRLEAREEVRVMPLPQRVQQRALRRVPRVARRDGADARRRASRGLRPW